MACESYTTFEAQFWLRQKSEERRKLGVMRPTPIAPKPGQESVWDYPRPPRLEPTSKRIRVISGGVLIVDTVHAYRVLETSHPPSFYVPPQDIKLEFFRPSNTSSTCEYKGAARYYDFNLGDESRRDVAWFYPNPTRVFAAIKDHLALYAARVVLQPGDGCFVDNERVTPQAGDFYGGWITSDVVGPFKGEPGSFGW
jgi:uncharacterized protein (DUF427 family)